MSKIFPYLLLVSPISSNSATFITGSSNQCDCNSRKLVDADSKDIVRYSDHVTGEVFEYSKRAQRHLNPTSKFWKLQFFLSAHKFLNILIIF